MDADNKKSINHFHLCLLLAWQPCPSPTIRVNLLAFLEKCKPMQWNQTYCMLYLRSNDLLLVPFSRLTISVVFGLPIPPIKSISPLGISQLEWEWRSYRRFSVRVVHEPDWNFLQFLESLPQPPHTVWPDWEWKKRFDCDISVNSQIKVPFVERSSGKL